MISDILFDALIEIEKYQENCPQVYDDLDKEISECKAAMRKLISLLDSPPIESNQEN